MKMRCVVEQVGVVCTVAAVGLVKIEDDLKEEEPEKNVIFHFFRQLVKGK
ncbi:MAG: hypothetical protein PVF58_04105 [Candidatus Methanofastidiosia archaeon]